MPCRRGGGDRCCGRILLGRPVTSLSFPVSFIPTWPHQAWERPLTHRRGRWAPGGVKGPASGSAGQTHTGRALASGPSGVGPADPQLCRLESDQHYVGGSVRLRKFRDRRQLAFGRKLRGRRRPPLHRPGWSSLRVRSGRREPRACSWGSARVRHRVRGVRSPGRREGPLLLVAGAAWIAS